MVFLWFSHGFPMVFSWFSYGFLMVFLWSSRVFLSFFFFVSVVFLFFILGFWRQSGFVALRKQKKQTSAAKKSKDLP